MARPLIRKNKCPISIMGDLDVPAMGGEKSCKYMNNYFHQKETA
jgi:hypothetical protein